MSYRLGINVLATIVIFIGATALADVREADASSLDYCAWYQATLNEAIYHCAATGGVALEYAGWCDESGFYLWTNCLYGSGGPTWP